MCAAAAFARRQSFSLAPSSARPPFRSWCTPNQCVGCVEHATLGGMDCEAQLGGGERTALQRAAACCCVLLRVAAANTPLLLLHVRRRAACPQAQPPTNGPSRDAPWLLMCTNWLPLWGLTSLSLCVLETTTTKLAAARADAPLSAPMRTPLRCYFAADAGSFNEQVMTIQERMF